MLKIINDWLSVKVQSRIELFVFGLITGFLGAGLCLIIFGL